MLSRYRESLRLWTDPVGRALLRLHLRPNQLTVCGLGLSLLTAAAFASGRPRVAGLVLVLAGLFDYFDGSLARASGRVTPFGASFDSVVGRYSHRVGLVGTILPYVPRPI